MSIYVMSDLHGCMEEFRKMLKLIRFSSEDELILDGDYIDRGPHSLRMLRWVMNSPKNVTLLRGNHDDNFYSYVRLMKALDDTVHVLGETPSPAEMEKLYSFAYYYSQKNGAYFDHYGTIYELITEKQVPFSDFQRFAAFLKSLPCIAERTVGDRHYLIVHAGYLDPSLPLPKGYGSFENFYLNARDEAYLQGGKEGTTVICGHTPTIIPGMMPFTGGTVFFYEDTDRHRRFIDIDCGCVYRAKYPDARLACIRLGDEAVYYV